MLADLIRRNMARDAAEAGITVEELGRREREAEERLTAICSRALAAEARLRQAGAEHAAVRREEAEQRFSRVQEAYLTIDDPRRYGSSGPVTDALRVAYLEMFGENLPFSEETVRAKLLPKLRSKTLLPDSTNG